MGYEVILVHSRLKLQTSSVTLLYIYMCTTDFSNYSIILLSRKLKTISNIRQVKYFIPLKLGANVQLHNHAPVRTMTTECGRQMYVVYANTF